MEQLPKFTTKNMDILDTGYELMNYSEAP